MDRIRPVNPPRLPGAPAATAPPLEDHAEWRELQLAGEDVSGARVRGVELTDVVLRDCNASNLTAVKSSLSRCAFAGCRMTGLALPDSTLEDVRFGDCLIDLAAFGFSRFRRVIFDGCILRDADFTDARLESVRFHRCELDRATFTGARFAKSEMRGCTLEGIRGIEGLKGVAMDWSDVVGLAGTFAAALGIEVLDEDG
jgi:uncharacterized protein YjbI with pentapeptide repeats